MSKLELLEKIPIIEIKVAETIRITIGDDVKIFHDYSTIVASNED